MFTIGNILLFLFFLCLISSIWLVLRWKALKRGFKDSGKVKFIDFLEIDYLGMWHFSWRRKFNNIYNTNKYWILYGILIGFLFIISIITIIMYCNISGIGSGELLNYQI